jgi:TRAP-type C4-dicarboxylate transport system substrate-binding protein
MFMSKRTFDKLPPDLQQVVIKAAREATNYERKVESDAGKAAEADMQAKFNVKFNTIDKTPFKTATKPVIVEFAKNMGLTDLVTSIDEVK